MSPSNEGSQPPAADMGRVLRRNMLTADPVEAGLAPTREFPRVYGVLMDWPVGGGDIATVASLADGNASLYTTASFGIIGGFAYEAVRENAIEFVRIAERHFNEAVPAETFDYPPSDRVRFYLLTFEGVRFLDVEAALLQDDHALTELFHQAQRVLTELRRIEQSGESDEGEGGTDPDWRGAPGYVNCMLTAMSEGLSRVIELNADLGVPILRDLAGDDAGLRQWIDEQNFDYEELSAKDVIALLKASASIGGLPFLSHNGELATIDIRKDGRRAARVFDLTIGPFGKTARIELAPEDDPRVIALQKEADERDGGRNS
ncbi:MAG: hypothetical protein HKN20_11650 [Gemmatimonadetes bacterium]|nr:hypothetical protein [Gemmatimonadota bacterium]